MLNQLRIINNSVAIILVNLIATNYASEVCHHGVELNHENSEVVKGARKIKLSNYLMYIHYKLKNINIMTWKKYQLKLNIDSLEIGRFRSVKEGTMEECDFNDIDLLRNFYLQDPDFLLIQDLIPMKKKKKLQDKIFLRLRLLQMVWDDLSKEAIIEMEREYAAKKSGERINSITKILELFRIKPFEDSAEQWEPKTSEEYLQVSTVLVALFEMVRTNKVDINFLLKNIRNYNKSRFDFVT